MLRFLRTHITGIESKSDDFDDFYHYSKVATHGFPQNLSCFAIDPELSLLALATKDGRIKILGSEKVEWEGHLESNTPIAYIYFVMGQGVLHLLCDDPYSGTQSFYRCRIQNDKLEIRKVVHQIPLKKITCAEMLDRSDGNSALLIGTIIGNVYALWTNSLELSEYIVFEDTSLKNVAILSESKSIDKIIASPRSSSTLFMLFNNSIVVVYDSVHDEVSHEFSLPLYVANLFLHPIKPQLFASHPNGSYSIYDYEKNEALETKMPFGPYPCMSISKICCTSSLNHASELHIFSGGMPKASYGDRYTVSIFTSDCEVVFDFDSRVIDFLIYNENDLGSALFVLCEQELVAIDLMDPDWKSFRLPYLYPLHYTPVTAVHLTSKISEQVFEALKEAHQEQDRMMSRNFSNRQWPITCGKDKDRLNEIELRNVSLLITGHENGTINVWRTDRIGFAPFVTLMTACEFDGLPENMLKDLTISNNRSISFSASEMDDKSEEWPPFKKVGLFDPFCDDPRLTVLKIVLDESTGELIVGGRAGQTMVYELGREHKKSDSISSIAIDMTDNVSNGNSTNTRNRQLPLPTRRSEITYPCGFQPLSNRVVQLKPASNITAVGWMSSRKFLAIGNEYGYAICNLANGHVVLKNCLLSMNEIVELSNVDGALSRFKSMKKSIRQSFRRKKRTVEQNGRIDGTLSPIEEMRPVEREIAARNDNPNLQQGELPLSLVKVARFISINNDSHDNSHSMDSLFIGTQGGTILVHAIRQDKDLDEELCPLIKEIRLQHRAPIIHIDYLPDPFPRMLVFSEEQIRSFVWPSMKSHRYKFKLTSIEGSRIRKVQMVLLTSRKNKKITDRFMLVVSNHGDIYLFSSHNPRKYTKIPFTKSADILGIASSTINSEGEMFFLNTGGSELQRCNITHYPNLMLMSTFNENNFP